MKRLYYLLDTLKYKIDAYIIIWFEKHYAWWIVEERADAIWNYILIEQEKKGKW